MTTEDGLSKDGLSYRSDIYAMDLLIKIYVYGSILWVALIITIIVNNIRTRPIKPRKEKIYEKLHTYSKRQRTPRMTYVDSKSFSSDRDKWEKEKSTEGSTRSERGKWKIGTSSKETTTAYTATTTRTGTSSGESYDKTSKGGESYERTSRNGALPMSSNESDERSVEIGKTMAL